MALRVIFSQLPHWDKKSATIQSYGQGRTNQNYLLEVGGQGYFIRLGSPTREMLGLSFANEIELIQLAVSLELSPPILVADAEQGIIIFPFISGKPIDIRQRDKLAEAMQMIKKLHHSEPKLSFRATPEDFITHYLKVLTQLKIELSSKQQQLINNRPRPIYTELVSCHLNLCHDNFIDDGNRLWLIDWEYGGMSDPLLDIAQLTPSEYFSKEESMLALSLYLYADFPYKKERKTTRLFAKNWLIASISL